MIYYCLLENDTDVKFNGINECKCLAATIEICCEHNVPYRCMTKLIANIYFI